MRMFKRNRKGDLSLSVNAIVVLIMAIVILGLGLAFVRGIFKKASTMIEDLDPKILVNPPTADNVMTSSPISVKLVGNSQLKVVQVAYYNGGPKTKCLKLVTKSTPDATVSPYAGKINIASSSICTGVAKDQIKAWSVQVSTGDITSATPPTKYMGVATFDVQGNDLPSGATSCTCTGLSVASTDVPLFIIPAE